MGFGVRMPATTSSPWALVRYSPIDHVLAGAGIAGKAHAGGGIVAHVAEHHGADVDCGAVGLFLGNPELLAVIHRALAHPGTEYGTHGNFQLFERILREGFAAVAFHDGKKLCCKCLQVIRAKIDIQRRAIFALDGCHRLIEMFVADAQRDLAEQLDEAAVGIPGKAFVTGLLDQARQ